MTEYQKIDGTIYEVTKRVVDLISLKEQLAVEEAMKEPTDKELIAEGKAVHSYYMRDTKALEDKITELESIK